MFIDSHCHLNYPQFKNDLAQVLKNAQEFGVEKMITICTQMSDFPEICQIIEQNQTVFGAFGIHPCNVQADSILNVDEIIDNCKKHPKIVAIGESGLDFFHAGFDKDAQKESFVNHIQVAAQLDLPLVIHSRNADYEMIEILQAEMKNSPFRGVMHCFASTEKLAKVALDLGLYISFSGIITFNSAKEIQTIAANSPLDRVLIETDAPFLAPTPYRGKRNEPAFVKLVGEKLAQLRMMEVEKLAEILEKNTLNLFHKIKNN